MKRLFKIQFLLTLLLSTMIFANIGGGIAPTVAPTISVNETLILMPQYGDTQKYAYYKFTVPNNTEATITYTAPSDERIYFVLHKTSPHKQLITKLTDEGSTKNVQATLSAGEYYFLIKKYGASTQGIPLTISLDDGGEPETTQTWRIYDATPEGASIITVNDAQKGTVVKLSGDGTQNGYVLGGWENSAEALNSTKKSIRWSMKYNENFTIFVRVMTKNGGRYLMYSNTPYNYAVNNAYVHKGLGKSVANGTWQTIERDLEADLQTNEPNNSITAINGFYVRGSGLFDTVELGNDTVTPPVITLKGANPVNLKVGDSYIEAGAIATDAVDGDVSASILIDGDTVNTSKVGRYTVTYNVSDEKGNKAVEVSRTVVVKNVQTPPPLKDATDADIIDYPQGTPNIPKTIIIKNMHFKGKGNSPQKEAIHVEGTGTEEVYIENCYFEDWGLPIYIKNVKKVYIRSVNFKNTGGTIVISETIDIDIEYLQMKNIGVIDMIGFPVREYVARVSGASSVLAVVSEPEQQYWINDCNSYNLGHVLIDNSGVGNRSLRPDGTTLRGDYFSTTYLRMSQKGKKGKGYVHDIYAIGHETDSTVSGLVPFDQGNSNMTYENINGLYVAAYAFGGWGCKGALYKNCRAFMQYDPNHPLHPHVSAPRMIADEYSFFPIVMNDRPGAGDDIIRDITFDNVLVGNPVSWLDGKTAPMSYTKSLEEPSRNNKFINSNMKFGSSWIDPNQNAQHGSTVEGFVEPTEESMRDIIEGKDRAGMFKTHGTKAGYLPVNW